jgi:hypothetical protein
MYSWTSWPLKMGLICSPETSVSNHLMLRNNPEDGRIRFTRGRSLWSRISNLHVCYIFLHCTPLTSLDNFLHPPITSVIHPYNYSAIFRSYPKSRFFSWALKVKDQVPHPHKTNPTRSSYILLTYNLLNRRRRYKSFVSKQQWAFPGFKFLLNWRLNSSGMLGCVDW